MTAGRERTPQRARGRAVGGATSGRISAPAEPIRIERLVAGGDGLGRLDDGRVVFVPGTLPGEAVLIRVTDERRDFVRAEAAVVVEPHPARVVPPCPAVAAGCGGCDWQHAATGAQLDLKVEIVRDALRRTARIDEPVLIAGGSVPAWGYRTTMRFAPARPDAGGWSRLGLRRTRSNDVVPLDACPVAVPELSALIADARVRGAEELTLRVSRATGAGTAIAAAGQAADRRSARRSNDRRRPEVSGLPEHVTVGADVSLVERVAGVGLRVSARSFFQSGPAAAELLVRTVDRLAGDVLATADRVVDAYGGIGLFAATVVPSSAEIVLVESSRSSCDDAVVNLAGRAATVCATTMEAWQPVDADVVIADPARQGLQREGVAQIVATGAPTVVLISCDPVSFARDVALLHDAGYAAGPAHVLDLFPGTHHVEVVARLDRVR